MDEIKFQFTLEFQLDLLRFTVQDINGYKALELYNDSYFTLVEHAVIAYTLKRYYKKFRDIPGQTILLEELFKTFFENKFRDLITKEDKDLIIEVCKSLYKGIVKDGDQILLRAERFSQFVSLKGIMETADLLDYHQYDQLAKQVQKAVSPRLTEKENKGSFLVADVKERQFNRQDRSLIIPTPFKQMNKLTNAGGYAKGSIIVILDEPKKFKTGMLINTARGYLRHKKNVLYIDLENGEDELTIRVEQGVINKTKAEVLSGEYDKQIQKALRKYKRIGAELVTKRLPAMSSTSMDIENYMDTVYREYGISFQILIIDYMGKLGCTSGKENMSERISEAYVEISNLALKKGIEHVWTAQHVQRAASVHRKTRYEGNDIAGDINIIRNAQAIWGLNRTPEEESLGIQRLELVDQRDGKPKGRVVFFVDANTQRLVEMTREQRTEFDNQFNQLNKDEPIEKKRRTKDIEEDV